MVYSLLEIDSFGSLKKEIPNTNIDVLEEDSKFSICNKFS
jgi:hypothetical protein